MENIKKEQISLIETIKIYEDIGIELGLKCVMFIISKKLKGKKQCNE